MPHRVVRLASAALVAVLLLWSVPEKALATREESRVPLRQPVDQLAAEVEQERQVALEEQPTPVKSGDTSASHKGLSATIFIGLAIALTAAVAAAGSTYVYMKPDLGLLVHKTTEGDLTLEEAVDSIAEGILDSERFMREGTDYMTNLSDEEREVEKEHIMKQLAPHLRQEDMKDKPTTTWVEVKLRSGDQVSTMLHVFKLQPRKSEYQEPKDQQQHQQQQHLLLLLSDAIAASGTVSQQQQQQQQNAAACAKNCLYSFVAN
ncbi:hypothetical protein Emed_004011 [Eimeria media]